MEVIEPAIARAQRGGEFSVAHFSFQGNHVHLLVEARDNRALSEGVQGLSVRLAKGLNRMMGERGSVFSDRYHAHVLRTPGEVRHAIAYVLLDPRAALATRGPGDTVTLLGIDGCRAGWIAAMASGPDEPPRFHLFRTFTEVVAALRGRGAIACVDVPIGLCDTGRRCDAEARALLGPARACSVFTPPSRSAVAGATAAEIRALNLRATGRSLSAQTLGIVPKIREVDAAVTPALQARVREVHPELVFASLAPGGRGLASSKRTKQGRRDRLALLPPALARAAPARGSRPFSASLVALDDYLDALAALVTAGRLARGEMRRVPAHGVDRDARGLAMEIAW
jgi:predicted RNase H-like nuclease